VNLRDLMQEVHRFDNRRSSKDEITALDPHFIFHESRTGSTLLANVLAYSRESLPNRVYSEAGPPLTALKICGDNYVHCSKETAIQIFKDVIYLMGRIPTGSKSDSPHHLFFKMQSIATISIDVVQAAFPDAPWVFVYRDPVEVLVSHLNIVHVERAKCLQSKRRPQHHIQDFLDRSRLTLKQLSNEEFCAIYLSTICDSALQALNAPENKGYAVNYHDALDVLMNDILPTHFNIPLTSNEISRMTDVGKLYSKAREGDFQWTGSSEDSERKQEVASDAIHRASDEFLTFCYAQLENMKHRKT